MVRGTPTEEISKEAKSHESESVFFPLLIIFIGIVLLLVNTGLLSPSAWEGLWRFWPLILILAGLDHLLGSSFPARMIKLFLGAVFFGGLLWMILYRAGLVELSSPWRNWVDQLIKPVPVRQQRYHWG